MRKKPICVQEKNKCLQAIMKINAVPAVNHKVSE